MFRRSGSKELSSRDRVQNKSALSRALFIFLAICSTKAVADDLTPHVQKLADEQVILRLDDILEEIPETYSGDVLDAELVETTSKAMLYNLRIMKNDGRVLDLVVDAKTATIKKVLGD